MEDTTRISIRRLLKTFGVGADEALTAFLDRYPELDSVRVRITLEDVTAHGEKRPDKPLHFVVEDVVEQG